MSIISLRNVDAISRGDGSRKLKYLLQFIELVPTRCSELEDALRNNERLLIRQILHKMSPQIQFFEIKDTVSTISRLENEYETLDYGELRDLINSIVYRLELAVEEVRQFIHH